MRQTDEPPLLLQGVPRVLRPLPAPHVNDHHAPAKVQRQDSADVPLPSRSCHRATSAAVASPAALPAPASEAAISAEMADLAERMARLMPGPKAVNLDLLTNPILTPFSSRRF